MTRFRRLVVATGNPGKVREITSMMAGFAWPIVSLHGLGDVRFPEEGGDYAANALAKAEAVARQLGEWAVADDSGLEVDGLEGRPGPYSARYGGAGLDDAGRVGHLLSELGDASGQARRARFVCIAAVASPEGWGQTFEGICPGRILEAPRGEGGFGYDPVFEPEGHAQSMAELPASEKNRISHRGRAFALLEDALRERLGPGL